MSWPGNEARGLSRVVDVRDGAIAGGVAEVVADGGYDELLARITRHGGLGWNHGSQFRPRHGAR